MLEALYLSLDVATNEDLCDTINRIINTLKSLVSRKLHGYCHYLSNVDSFKCTLT